MLSLLYNLSAGSSFLPDANIDIYFNTRKHQNAIFTSFVSKTRING